jgi:hypothetical protein
MVMSRSAAELRPGDGAGVRRGVTIALKGARHDHPNPARAQRGERRRGHGVLRAPVRGARAQQREGYATPIIADPPLTLVLIEKPGAGGGLNHLGVAAPPSDHVAAALTRFREAGLHTDVAEQDVCCHPGQHMTYLTPGHTSADA